MPSTPPSQDLKPEDYTYELSKEEVAEIIAGTDAILARGVKDEEDIKKVGVGSKLQRMPARLVSAAGTG